MKPVINSNKHFVARTAVVVGGGAILNIEMVAAIVAPATAAVQNVEEGSIVKAVHVELWIIGDGISDVTDQFVITIVKQPADAPNMTVTNSLNLQGYLNKKNILYTTQGIVGSDIDGGTVRILNDWVLIPKGKQRMGLDDKIMLNVHAVAVNMRICGMFIYKEYR